jgi:peptidoglycan/xylan/chitin deacetylase (PgdA/CDA1 family)
VRHECCYVGSGSGAAGKCRALIRDRLREAGRTLTALLLTISALIGVGLIVFWIEPLGVLSALERLTPQLIYRIRTPHPLVALSFDDGPHPVFTIQVLKILERHNSTATFFLIGDRALRHPEVVAQIRAAGHQVANHYFSDGSILGHSDAEFDSYLQQTEEAIGITTATKLFRPPGGVARPGQLRLAQAHGYKCVLGCAYPHDPIHPPVCYIRWLIEKNLRPGTIVILHDGISDPTRSIQALPHILEECTRRGLHFVSIGALMSGAAEQSDER